MASSHENKTVLFRANPATRDADADLDIIAIHGLDTKSPETWTARSKTPGGNVNWLLDDNMLAARVRRARIFTCNWPAELLQKPDTIATTLEESARHLLGTLRLHMAESRRETPRRPTRPILFIASCLGGIILIKALEMDMGLDSDERDLMALRKATRGIVFLATPFHGTSFKEMPEFALPLWARLGGHTVSALINCTREPPSHLDELINNFVELQRKHDVRAVYFWEGKKTNLLRKIHLAWVFSPYLHIVWFVVLLTALRLHYFSPWLLVAYFPWFSGARAYQPKELVHQNSATLPGGRGQRLDRIHVLMNKFDSVECQHYSIVAKTIEEMAVQIREGSLLARADRMIKQRYLNSGKLMIKRLSGDPLSMESCYINLAVVEKSGDGRNPGADDSVSFSLLNRQKVKTPRKTSQVNLSKIFDSQQEEGGKQPRRILIQGRAGVGKTTLCKKIVHDFYTPGTELHCSWTKLFDRLLWVPLRNLKSGNTYNTPGYNLELLFLHEFFSRPKSEPEFARELSESMEAVASRTLFLLDGLDEILHDLKSSDAMYDFVQELLNQSNVIITSRPSAARLSKGVGPADLELETVGFYPYQVDEYVRMAFTDTHDPASPRIDQDKVEQVLNFLKQHWLIQSLVRIPIQLDALCYTWNDRLEAVPDTMTSMYKLIELKLWKKDMVHRLGVRREGDEPLSEDDIQSVGLEYIESRVSKEISFLEGLAFSGLINNIIDFQETHVKMIAGQFSPGLLHSKTCRDVSFLRSSDSSLATSDQRCHFIHLTFQEYFAARYFVKQWKSKHELVTLRFDDERKSRIANVSVEDFLRGEKYNASYDIFWRFVAGLLGGNDEDVCDFFCKIQNEPRDLIGPVHQRLVIHCLSEISLQKVPKFQKLYQQLKCEAKQWLLLELQMKRRSELAAEMEFPDEILVEAFGAKSEEGFREVKAKLYGSLVRRPALSSAVMEHIASCLGGSEKDLIKGAFPLIRWAPGNTSKKVIRATVNLLKDDDERVRSDAAHVLMQQLALSQDVVQAIVSLATDPENCNRISAFLALQTQRALPQGVLQTLVDLLKDNNVADYAAFTLRAQSVLPQDVVKALASLLKDPGNRVRAKALLALKTQTALAQHVVQALVNLLQDPDKEVCLNAVAVLGQQSRLSQSVFQALVKMLQSPGERRLLSSAGGALPGEMEETENWRKDLVLEEVARVLLSRVAPSDDVFQELVHLLKNGPKISQQSIAGSLSNRHVPTPHVIQLMAHVKDHPDAAVRFNAATAMGSRLWEETWPEELTPVLEHLLKDSVKYVRISAFTAFKFQGGPWPLGLQEELVRVAVDLLTDSDQNVRKMAAIEGRDLVSLSEEVAQALANLLRDPDTAVRQAAAASFRAWHTTLPKQAIQIAAGLLEDPEKDDLAIEALANQSDLPEEVLQRLVRCLGRGARITNPKFRDPEYLAVDILCRHAKLPKQVIQTLKSALHDPSPRRRGQAADILKHQAELPLDVLQTMRNLPKVQEFPLSADIEAEAFDRLVALPDQSFSNLAEMDDQCFTRLYQEWLRRAFCDHRLFYEENQVYHIHLPRGHREIPVPKLQRAVQAARKALKVPDVKPLSTKDSYQQLT